MEKTCYRFFGGFLSVQEKWLNKMAGEGYRLAHVGKLAYRFETYGSGKVQYRVEFIGAKPKEDAEEYYGFLESFGYRVFYKNINLNASLGKIRWRPWAGKGGKIASNATTYNRELLIVEKADNGKPFELHTTYEDKQVQGAGETLPVPCPDVRCPWHFHAGLGFLHIFCLFPDSIWGVPGGTFPAEKAV